MTPHHTKSCGSHPDSPHGKLEDCEVCDKTIIKNSNTNVNEYTTNQPIGSTKSNEPIFGGNPVCPDCLPYDKCAKHSDKLNATIIGNTHGAVNSIPVMDTACATCGQINGFHLDGCFKSTMPIAPTRPPLPINNCREKHCSRLHPIDDEPLKRNLEQQLLDVLINHTGEHGQNEGAVECLERIIRERDLLLKRAVEVMLKPSHF